jgi:hypothetical protein
MNFNEAEESPANPKSAYIADRLTNFRDRVLPSLSSHWMRNSLAVSHLEEVLDHTASDDEFFSCGPVAFAALGGIHRSQIDSFFPKCIKQSWTNRSEMEQALKKLGWRFEKVADQWPRLGLCYVQWTGPWVGGYPAEEIKHTHWVAVIEDFVFDVNWKGWLPRENWEEVVVEDILRSHPFANGWKPKTAYEFYI